MGGVQIEHRSRARGKTSKSAHSEESKNLALAIYAETLNCEEAARQTGIPQSTIRTWTQTEEGDAKINELRAALRYQLAFKLTQVSQEAIRQIEDRLTNGDERLLPNGEIVRVKIPGKELASIASMAIDKHALLTGTIDAGKNIKAGVESLAQALGKLGQTAGDNAKLVIDQEDNPNPNVTNSEKVG